MMKLSTFSATALTCLLALAAGCVDEPDVSTDIEVTYNEQAFQRILERANVFDNWDVDEDRTLDGDEFAANSFDVWDISGNGRISDLEWSLATSEWYPGVKMSFTQWDEDGNGYVDQIEFVDSLQRTKLRGRWDASGNGRIEFDEFADNVMAIWDDDENGRIEPREVRLMAWNGDRFIHY